MSDLPEKIGRYEILSLVGRGAMGLVYRARDPYIGRVVAVKKISIGELIPPGQRKEFTERFFREARTAGGLKHPNIVTIHDVGESDGIPFMAMEYIEGSSLARLMKEQGPFPVGLTVSIARQVALALAYAHERNIVHRDIKPDNILVDTSGRVVVTDFGAAHLHDSELTRTGEVLGTPHYMSPEQILGESVDGRSDLFSLGVVLYLMVTGRRPFKGDTVSSVCYHIVHSQPEPVPSDAGLPPQAAPIVERLLAKSRDDRYTSGTDVVRDLDALESGGEGKAPAATMTQTVNIPSSPPGPPPVPLESGGGSKAFFWLALGGGALLLLAILLGGGLFLLKMIASRQEPVSAPAPQQVAAPVAVESVPEEDSAGPASAEEAEPVAAVPDAAEPAPPPPPPPRAETRRERRSAPKAAPSAPAAAPAPSTSPEAVRLSDEILEEAASVSALARGQRFSEAFALLDAFPGRLEELGSLAAMGDMARVTRAREAVETARKETMSALSDWAAPRIRQARETYLTATDGINDDEEMIIQAYIQAAPVLRWRKRLPASQRAPLDLLVEECREDLDEEEWETAKALAEGKPPPREDD